MSERTAGFCVVASVTAWAMILPAWLGCEAAPAGVQATPAAAEPIAYAESTGLFVTRYEGDRVYIVNRPGGGAGVFAVRDRPSQAVLERASVAGEVQSQRRIIDRLNERILELERCAAESSPGRDLALIVQLQSQVADLNDRIIRLEGPPPEDDPPVPPDAEMDGPMFFEFQIPAKPRPPSRLDIPAMSAGVHYRQAINLADRRR